MEARKVVKNVQCINGGLTSVGTLRLTDFHLVFCAPLPPLKDQNKDDSNHNSQPLPPPKHRESWITYPILSHCTLRLMPPNHGIHSSIRIRCRDFIFVTFMFEDNNVARDVFEFVKLRTCKLGTIENLFAFSHKGSKAERQVNGWKIYDPKAEFRRQGISEKSADKGWRITNINKDYTFCDTYPAILVVPSSISDNVLKYAKEYRSRHRIPVLSYIHPANNCTITRSAQPLSGITRKNNIQDEKLVMASFAPTVPRTSIDRDQPPRRSQSDTSQKNSLDESELSEQARLEEQAIADAEPKMYDEKGKRLIYGAQQANMIVDARPTVNAMVNQVQGMGSEPMDRYPGAKKAFMNIENIHVMRSSLAKVVDCLKDADISPLSPDQNALASTGWLRHTQAVLNGADIVARQVWFKHSHVLIHCSDGWDRTSQLSALAQILLDPYYRTIEGFIVLVEKDWVSFGHMFRLRSGHLNHESWFTVQKDGMAGSTVQPGDNDGRDDAFQNLFTGARQFFNPNKEEAADLEAVAEGSTGKVAKDEATVPKMISPVFHQFLDCVYQLLRQNPTKFEFNERFLRRLIYHLYSCQYGTFLYNSEKQRTEARASERTASVWDYFLSRRPEFTNKEYDPTIDEYVKDRGRIIKPNLDDIRWWHQLFNRTDEEMNSQLNAVAAAAVNRASALANFQPSTEESYVDSQPGTPPQEASSPKPPPALPTSQSVLAAVETAHTTLTPSRQERQAPALHRSVSAENSNAFSALRDGIAGLNIGKNVSGMLTNLGGRNASPASNSRVTSRTEQELREMT
ncbi:protein-tyrosine phosphatase-like protein [Colletotrichum navitas]|uniref:Protein-tyrosine phosphatase-like protein n=1 Tax=Colletotrichum navitas TaxID=681940 RepID=A0AAD8VBK8_9PEZI|nr:protein-tyrosine phosphatase-like protein [Colletotrichum navitas]KAK1598580.1 protein-tyrosine phosphatase-like protein [Colletotrichum navitas]